ncbi:hypothetical protein BJ170DRAFT_720603 [Xylariales sp. AK1849]|nr:hypothetical protein BJ170DRAFT_720603 [Xylariales sp. AK1849]
MAEQEKRLDRPSFTGFWKTSDNEDSDKQLKIVPYDEQKAANKWKRQNEGELEAHKDSIQIRAHNRRSQVRKAQLQHRQRKADYIEQLESDIKKLNYDIEGTEMSRQVLEQENEAIRQSISAANTPQSTTFRFDIQDPLGNPSDTPPGYVLSLGASDEGGIQGLYGGYPDSQEPDISGPSVPESNQDIVHDTGEHEDQDQVDFATGYDDYFDHQSYYRG